MVQRKNVAALLMAWILFTVGAAQLEAAVRLPRVFSDHMVVQRECPIAVWGWADPNEKVTVTLGAARAEAVADRDGCWSVKLHAMPAGGPHSLSVAGTNTLTVRDILIGEVWLCSGQSNMNMPIDWGIFGAWGTPECTTALAEIDDPQLRMFLVDRAVSVEPADDLGGQWKIAKGNEVLKWSAAGYFFGVELRRELNVPVGLLKSAVGGTRIESWTGRSALLAAVPEMKTSFEQWGRRVAAFDEAQYQKELGAWRVQAEKAKQAGQRAPRQPVRATEQVGMPSGLYNGMIAPLVPYGMRGVIWYQGESNARQAFQYRRTFPAMIRDWRRVWGQGDFPFLFVQLANYGQIPAEPVESQWAELREAQTMALSEPNTAMTVAIEIGEPGDIHPKNKQDVGRRLAMGALKLAYGRDVVHSGPIYESMAVEDGRVRVCFSHVGGGLMAKGGELKGFAVAGQDRKFVWADARIDGDAVVVGSAQVARPVAVRYGWADSPECNLYNREGLPASPFRTDDWPGLTQR